MQLSRVQISGRVGHGTAPYPYNRLLYFIRCKKELLEPIDSALLVNLEDEHEWVRRQAAEALGKLGLKSSEVLPGVVQWIDRPQDTAYVGSGIDVLWDLVAS